MNKARVLLVNHTPEPERICAASARLSTKEGAAVLIYEETLRENIGKLISNVMKLGHHSIAEHASFSFAFEDVSVFFEQYLIGFRLASYTVKSRRYVYYSGMGCLKPDFRFSDPGADKEKLSALYEKEMEDLFLSYSRLVDLGIPKEDARFLLPYSLCSHIYCTMNARELLHFLNRSLYGEGSSYPEVYYLAESLLKQVKEVFPDIFESFPSLSTAKKEGKDLFPALLKDRFKGKGEALDTPLLVSAPDDPERKLALAALINQGFNPGQAEEILKDSPLLIRELIADILDKDRLRELEQINFSFYIPGLSLASLTHLSRHRIQSLLIPKLEDHVREDCILPESIAENKNALDIYKKAVKKHALLKESFEEAEVFNEDRVYLFLSGNKIDVLSSMNLRQLYHFLALRTCFRAQWEIRDIAWSIRKILMERAPLLFASSGPACLRRSSCPEGKMSCGRMLEVRALADKQGL